MAQQKEEPGDLGVETTTRERTGFDKQKVAEVIKRMKSMAKDDENRFVKMGMKESLERLEQSQKVASTIDKAYQVEMARKKALLRCFISENIQPPAPEAAEPMPTGSATAPAVTAETGVGASQEMSDQEAVDLVKLQLANTQAESRRKLATAKTTRVHNDAMVAALEEKGIAVPEVTSYFTDID
mmetsp:Transcript_25331/g.63416  ORF Transcript_25331/g.63416 Transcript_25331/m.63416 type:complete len:184 (-) Transcript_25331:440-991(-)|eukprot:CAMPEP_0181368268 /NCGR_PEP_ID=MMETSP1106-20121128/11974_1 /TAXON_ID=81844 /ORGANISM="Mantoniella antarctica, Strain SL-175" /LENGTH=183 /DNA_ID=CAMNT_0023484327 /DNA_START=155 /DNA_END=706 /DNA_ORIENTATION=+